MENDSSFVYLPWGDPMQMYEDIRALYSHRMKLPLYCVTPYVLLVAAMDTMNAAHSSRERHLQFQRACRAVRTRNRIVDTNRTTSMEVSYFVLHSCHLTFIRSYQESTICTDWQFFLVFISMLEQKLRSELGLRRRYAIRTPPAPEFQRTEAVAGSGESMV